MNAVARFKPFMRRRPWSAAVLGIAGLVAVLAVARSAWTIWSSFDPAFGAVLVLPRVLEIGVLIAGLYLIAKGMPYRVGDSLHCARCGYQRVEEHDRLLINCPECGHYWRLFGGWRTGKPLGDRRAVKIGVLLCVVGVAVISGRGLASRWITEQMTSPMLIRHVLYAPTEVASQAWDVLERRQLTIDQIRRLASELLNRRTQSGWLDARSVQWIHDRMADGTLEPDVITRYFEEVADFAILAPSSAAAGEKFEASVAAAFRGSVLVAPEGPITFACSGIEIELPGPAADDVVTPLERQFLTGPNVLPPQEPADRAISPFETRKASKLSSAAASSRFAGVATVRATVWILVGPSAGDSMEYPRGAALRSSGTINRAIRRDLVREVEILRTTTADATAGTNP